MHEQKKNPHTNFFNSRSCQVQTLCDRIHSVKQNKKKKQKKKTIYFIRESVRKTINKQMHTMGRVKKNCWRFEQALRIHFFFFFFFFLRKHKINIYSFFSFIIIFICVRLTNLHATVTWLYDIRMFVGYIHHI